MNTLVTPSPEGPSMAHALTTAPTRRKAWQVLGQWLTVQKVKVWQLVGASDKAQAAYRAWLAKDPSDAAIRESLAFSLAQTGQTDEALRELDTVVAQHPQRATAWFNRGFLHDQAGRRVEAEADFRQAVGLDEKLDRAWYGLALVLIAQQQLEDAIKPLKKNIKLQPMSPYGYYQLARVYFDLGNVQEVRKIIRHLKGFEPKVATQLELETKITVAE